MKKTTIKMVTLLVVLLSMSCTGYENGEHVVYHRLYNVLSLTVISNKNTVGYYDMDSEVEAVREEKA